MKKRKKYWKLNKIKETFPQNYIDKNNNFRSNFSQTTKTH